MLISRRSLLASAAGVPAILRGAAMTSRERVERALDGKDVDRVPFSLWHHFKLEAQGPAAHAQAILKFHRDYQTDFVKVMSDFPYPKAAKGAWYELKPEASPFAPQIKALELIRDGLKSSGTPWVETLFNPVNVAEKLSSKEEVQRMMRAEPDKLLRALEVIAQSEANHARLALKTGATGIFLAIANAQDGIMTKAQYTKFSEPFDRMVLEAAKGARLNILHLHGPKVHLDLFWKGWPGAALNFSVHETGTTMAQARAKAPDAVLIGGTDQRIYRERAVADLKADIATARREAGRKLLFTPGCSVPDDSQPAELKKLVQAAG